MLFKVGVAGLVASLDARMRHSCFLIGALGALVISSNVSAAPRIITQPDWLDRPSGEALSDAYPQLARRLDIEGLATIGCDISVEGLLKNCKVLAETPKGLGFGDGALSMTSTFRMKPMTLNGEPVDGGVVRIPIAFRMPPENWEAPPPLTQPSSPGAMELARKLMVAIYAADAVEARFKDAAAELDYLPARETTDTVRAAAAAALREALQTSLPRMREDVARLYAAAFSEPELQALLAFAQSPVGSAVLGVDEDARAIQTVVSREFQRAQMEAARAAFCALRSCREEEDPLVLARDAAGPHPLIQIAAPTWTQAPTEEDIERARPFAARWLRLGGAVRLTCAASSGGLMTSCKVASETPQGLGLGLAGLKLANFYRLSPTLLPLGAAGQSLAVRIRFIAPEPDEPTESPKPRSAHALALAMAVIQGGGVASAEEWISRALKFSVDTPEGLSQEDKEVILTAMTRGVQSATPKTLEMVSAYLTHRLTDQQLIEATAFWQTPTGRAWVARRAELAVDGAAMSYGYELAMWKDAGAIFCKARGCTQELRRVQPASTAKPEASIPTP